MCRANGTPAPVRRHPKTSAALTSIHGIGKCESKARARPSGKGVQESQARDLDVLPVKSRFVPQRLVGMLIWRLRRRSKDAGSFLPNLNYLYSVSQLYILRSTMLMPVNCDARSRPFHPKRECLLNIDNFEPRWTTVPINLILNLGMPT